MRTRSFGGSRRKPRAAWVALVTGVVVSALVVLAVLLPVLGLIGAADATTVGVLDVPVGAIALSIIVSYSVGLAFLALALVSRSATLAWISAVAAVIVSTPDPQDRRGVIVALSEAGEERVVRTLAERGDEFGDRVRDWSDDEVRTLTRLLRRLAGA